MFRLFLEKDFESKGGRKRKEKEDQKKNRKHKTMTYVEYIN